MAGFPAGYGTTDQGASLIGVDTTTITGNDRSSIPADATLVTTGPTDLKAGGALTMAAVAAKYNYLTSVSLSYLGATAASVIVGQVSGNNLLDGGARVFTIPVPIGATLAPQVLTIQYDPPLKTVSTNSTITFTVPSFGSGAGVANCTMSGYRAPA